MIREEEEVKPEFYGSEIIVRPSLTPASMHAVWKLQSQLHRVHFNLPNIECDVYLELPFLSKWVRKWVMSKNVLTHLLIIE